MEFFTPNRPASPNNLGLALVLCSSTPLVLLDAAFVVSAASATFCRAFGLDPDAVMGTELFALGGGEWNLTRLRSLLDATLSGDAAIDAYELELVRGANVQHLILNVQRLDYGETDEVCLVLAVSDVTAVRAAERHKDALVRDNQVLLKELQHRVANSLQIIASVLMQSARKVQSDEARIHLNDAHHRVLSIAMLQKQLAETATGDVALRPYFTDLCRTIGASMIADPARIRIVATVSDTVAKAEESVSLGLIVTELIINSLKHAFPEEVKSGNIAVNYSSDGLAWTLTVSDDGVGRPDKPLLGLGTGIVEALAKQLQASVKMENANPGTLVSVIHGAPEPLLA
ncbi:sensor histidine kinase [Novosphingobium sp. G106]|uniref:sensor histidine kinase n=1 Tax=Novosphingobium sp. G106 TaxID=2849500 RepID=UPI001C2D356D|nr:sensor histidine kinase [Novosphingobium sp. G106]MBV1690414.1 sensor histidine kinase [Novosphingobium sp. G106]